MAQDQTNNKEITLEYVQSLFRSSLPDNMKAGVQTKTPSFGQPSVWLATSGDVGLRSYDEVYPGILLGDSKIAMDKDLLKDLGVSHVLNAAQGQKFNQINTSEAFYPDFTFHGINAIDIAGFKMYPHFRPAADFIQTALDAGGKVLVHCQQGMSRSASLVLAYLMIHQGMTLEDAVRRVRKARCIRPNDGFLKQLCQLNSELHCEDSTAS